jgi:L-fuculose-phosphate aldolase
MAEDYVGVKFKTLFAGVDFDYPAERKAIVAELGKLKKQGLLPGIPGNVSVRVPKGIIITPAGKDLNFVKEGEMVLVTGVSEWTRTVRVVGPSLPSSEAFMHWLAYKARPKAGAVVHFHDDVLMKRAKNIATTDEFHDYGTLELAHAAAKALKKSPLIILKDHGFLVAGKDLTDCHRMIEKAEAKK